MLLEKLFDNLALTVDPFATCRLADGWRLRLPCQEWITLHYTMRGDGELKLGSGELLSMPCNSLAIMPPGLSHAVQCGTVAHETVSMARAIRTRRYASSSPGLWKILR